MLMAFSPCESDLKESAFQPGEMLAISEDIGRRYSPIIHPAQLASATRIVLTPEELLKISQEISKKYLPALKAAAPKIALVPIDPAHLYVSWNLDASKLNKEFGEKARNQNLVVRIYPKQKEAAGSSHRKTWFDVVAGQAHSRQKVFVPPAHRGSLYTAAIGVIDENKSFFPLAESEAAYKFFTIDEAVLNPSSSTNSISSYEPASIRQENVPDNRHNASGRDVN